MQPFVWVQPSEAMVSILHVRAMPLHMFHFMTPSVCANAVEFIINRAEVSIAFVQENKIPAIISILPNCSTHLKTIVSFTNVSSTQKKEAEELGVSGFLWEEFLQLGNSDSELHPKQRTAVCTIMYTSGMTGEPKGVIITKQH
ncbi:putative long-chain-fatty-acid--CoA ligase [Rosa chinensis]|uniref:Putative long-chain-fatty-acid--CoA ligase n=1 Tax=Rosa chinensis TaxID=74649 RepID=A0A2P6PNH9_ROSCH|nr:putative long-chain-fatty-acid--CoA ligase [Rosa chinensis]